MSAPTLHQCWEAFANDKLERVYVLDIHRANQPAQVRNAWLIFASQRCSATKEEALRRGLGVPGLRALAWEKVSFLPADAKHSCAGQMQRRPRVNQKGLGTINSINLNLRTPLRSEVPTK